MESSSRWPRPSPGLWMRIAAGALLLLLLLAGAGAGTLPWFAQLAGRFHHLLVHFPIALLLLAVVVELAGSRIPALASWRPLAGGLLGLGAWAALAAVVSGLLLSREGGYDEGLLGWHRGLGIAVAVAAVVAAALARGAPSQGLRRARAGVVIGLVAALVAAGHYGGSLAHGESYLTRDLPGPLRGWLGGGAAVDAAQIDAQPLFDGLIRPALERRCVACHGSAKSEGGLVLETREGLLAGGDGGPVLVAGDADASEIVTRSAASLGDPDRMPPDGRPPLTIEETELLRFWIESGADFEQTVGAARAGAPPSSVATALARIAPATAEPRTGIFALDVAPAAPDAVARAREAGFGVRPLHQDSPFLDVRASQPTASRGDRELAALEAVAPQIAWLNLSRTALSDEGLSVVGGMPHLTRLDLSGTGIGDDGLRALAGLSHLELLNLYGTAVSDAGLEALAGLERLRVVYLWQTQVTSEGAGRLRALRPGLSVNTGASGEARADEP